MNDDMPAHDPFAKQAAAGGDESMAGGGRGRGNVSTTEDRFDRFASGDESIVGGRRRPRRKEKKGEGMGLETASGRTVPEVKEGKEQHVVEAEGKVEEAGIKATVAFDEEFNPDIHRTPVFKDAMRAALAEAMGVPADQIRIDDVVKGSVIVNYTVKGNSDGKEGAAAAAAIDPAVLNAKLAECIARSENVFLKKMAGSIKPPEGQTGADEPEEAAIGAESTKCGEKESGGANHSRDDQLAELAARLENLESSIALQSGGEKVTGGGGEQGERDEEGSKLQSELERVERELQSAQRQAQQAAMNGILRRMKTSVGLAPLLFLFGANIPSLLLSKSQMKYQKACACSVADL